jgi:hypothetical protein
VIGRTSAGASGAAAASYSAAVSLTLDLPPGEGLANLCLMGRTTGQWCCRICGFDRWHIVTVKRKNGALYTTSFYACSGCSVMMLNPEQFNALGSAAPNIEMPTVVALRSRK